MSISSTKLMGGLGNYLFQIAAAFNIALRDNKRLVIDISDIDIVHEPIESYTKNIFRRINFQKGVGPAQPISQQGFHYVEIPKYETPTKLYGYFQSEKYFEQFSEQLRSLYGIDPETKNYILEKYGDSLNRKTCSLHVRRGNYLKFPENHPVLTTDYYKEAISHFDDDTLFLIFSDDIKWCEDNLTFIKNKVFITGNKDYQDLYLMSLCNDNIIENSSFSWWGDWLNENKNKKVIAPINWFGPSSTLYTGDIISEKWIKI